MRFILLDRVIEEKGLYVYNMDKTIEKHFCNSIAAVRSRGGLLVNTIKRRIQNNDEPNCFFL
jgi:hypothetical protein